ncbi:MAG TPA: TRAP transporter small permease [Xanthobacteraceae bacterium]|nr:TRAP transporter small permease [Xanthobacteraceae bacterium]
MAQIEARVEHGEVHRRPLVHGLAESSVERICRYACIAALVVMLVVVATDILTRWMLDFSFEISDELGGYLLVVIAFLSLPVCQISESFHRVELVQSRLSPFWRAVSNLIFDLLSFAFVALLLWQLGRFELTSYRFADRAPTYLATPLWVPQTTMLLGAAALCFSMLRTVLADVARLRAPGKATEDAGEP